MMARTEYSVRDQFPSAVTNRPLASLARLHTVDVDQAREVVAEAFCPHTLTPLDGAARFETRFHPMTTGDVRLAYLDYGGEVRITSLGQETFYLVLMPLAGRAEISHHRERFRYDPGGASVPPVTGSYDLRVDAGSPHLVAWIARGRLERHLGASLGRPVTSPVRFAVGMDLTAPALRSWRRVVDLLLHEADGDGLIHEPLARRELEGLLLTQLLLAQPNNYSASLHEHPLPTTPRLIRRAVEVIDGHAAEPLTVEDVAEAVGLSVRALQEGFRRHLGTTPMSYLREVRLTRVRDDLAGADPASVTVTATALRWGFRHAGRFSARYHQRFGESPSATLHR